MDPAGKGKQSPLFAVEQGLYPDPVPGSKQGAPAGVIHRKSKNAVELFQTPGFPLMIGLKHHFRITGGLKAVPGAFQQRRTRDDAAGEAFDKVARAIGLGYPGGPKIEKVSHEGDPKAISFPRAKIADGVYDFSFSGLKSAVLNYLNGCRMKNLPINQADVAASFQQSVTDVLVDHARHAIREYHMDSFAIAGGVASNGVIRAAMEQMCREEGVKFYHPSPILCTDNAAMIGAAAYYDFIAGKRAGLDLNAVPNLKLGE